VFTYIGFKNFFSFKEGAEVSFVLDKRVQETIPSYNGVSYIMGIKGANGSGKTNIIRAIGFVSKFIARSSNYSVEEKVKIDSFFDNSEPSEFSVEFILDGCNYSYDLILDKHKVHYEKLSRKIKREVVVFERKDDKVVECLKAISEIKKIKMKANSSLISMIDKFNFESPMEDLNRVLKYFELVVCNVGYAGLIDKFSGFDFTDVSEFYHENDELRIFMVDFLKTVDPSISNIRIIRSQPDGSDTVSYLPFFDHEYEGELYSLSIHDESSGTKILYKTLAMYWVTIVKGCVLALDEFDIHLHAMMLPKILELFENEKINDKQAQFIFTAHNTEIMDYLGKYRTVLVDKVGAESYCYRLDEIPTDILPNSVVRSDRKISNLYLKKKLGGVPNL